MLLHNQGCVTQHKPGELQIDPEDRAQIKDAHPSVFSLLFILYFPPFIHLLQVPLSRPRRPVSRAPLGEDTEGRRTAQK